MLLRIASPDFSLTDAIRERVESRIEKALARFESRLGPVSVGLNDLDGPRKGLDKRCRINCQIQSLRAIEVEATDRDLYAAIDEAAERARRIVERNLLKRRTLSRPRGMKRAQAAP
jgi:ribosomal subunit interface protein